MIQYSNTNLKEKKSWLIVEEKTIVAIVQDVVTVRVDVGEVFDVGSIILSLEVE